MERISQARARGTWLRAQRLDTAAAFGSGPAAAQAAIEHLGYVQIDTIHVIERSHHHILYTRIPSYQRRDLHYLQSEAKSVFEYWTHALSYLPLRDYRFFRRDMVELRVEPGRWYTSVKKAELAKVLRLIREQGPISIRDITDDVLVDKLHPWASRKPSKRALELAFYSGRLAVSRRVGMLKTYELTKRHFAWETLPKAATEQEIADYLLERALRSQAVVTVDSICFGAVRHKLRVRKLIEARVRRRELLAIEIDGAERLQCWARPEVLELPRPAAAGLTHILSPFDPLVILRKRLQLFFGYEHRFEAYVPKAKRVFGYFGLPVLMDDQVVAVLDLKTDREQRRLLVQKWTWLGRARSRERKARIESELHRFECFQLDQRASAARETRSV